MTIFPDANGRATLSARAGLVKVEIGPGISFFKLGCFRAGLVW
jgi:hypothetical protein